MIRSKHFRSKTLFLLSFFSILSALPVSAETPPTELQKTMEEAIRTGREVQKEADVWAEEREKIMAEIRDLRNRKQWIEYQQEKHETYLRKQEEVIQKLGGKKQSAEEIRMTMEPYLDEVVGRLEDFVESDLPFLPEERQKRLTFLRSSLNDYHLGLGEKLRRVAEALQVEAEYGKSMEKTESTLTLNGEPTQVYLFRLGRLALFYLSLDGSKAGRFNRKTGQWEALPRRDVGELSRAMEMVERKRAMELVTLPIGR